MHPMEPLVLEPVLRYEQLMALHGVAPMEPLVLEPLLKAAARPAKNAQAWDEQTVRLPDGQQCIAATRTAVFSVVRLPWSPV